MTTLSTQESASTNLPTNGNYLNLCDRTDDFKVPTESVQKLNRLIHPRLQPGVSCYFEMRNRFNVFLIPESRDVWVMKTVEAKLRAEATVRMRWFAAHIESLQNAYHTKLTPYISLNCPESYLGAEPSKCSGRDVPGAQGTIYLESKLANQ